ncbi:flagellar motor switch protein FliM [Sphingomonas sp. YR710]|jgi:flagellar motor switch protein FliM|uniref:flagellar motor switch protein FliM n=1 Tax=Sphingomonas sp. YR710 TaxID=1882773 RepID=UPI0008807F08|nr:flagellar motor switch protein FliM [Sphingomonas sp. YR710]SDD40935.1 flagellar motor switch protein FliM [Sphingomonas sp. YR710]
MTRASSSLSGDEVAALMDELSGISLGDDASADVSNVVPFTLGQKKDRPTADLALIERMNERLGRRMRDMIEPIAQARAQIEAHPLETRRFDEWQRNQPDFMSLSLFRIRPAKGTLMISIEPAFISNMVDAFYGGTSGGTATKSGEFTPSEERLLNRLTKGITEILERSWSEFYPLQFQPMAHETNPIFASMMRGDEGVVVQRFSIKPGITRSTRIEILYPLSMLQPIEDELTSRIHRDTDADAGEWRDKLAAALENVALPVRSVLARPEMTVAQLLALKPGDVIPINLSSTVPLLVGNRRFAEGTIGEQEGRAAMMIDTIGKGLLK